MPAPSSIPVEYFVILSAVLFIMGVLGVLVRRNAIMIFMSIELMLNAANLALVGFARQWGEVGGQLIVFFVITVAAAEVAVGLALIVAIYKSKKTIDIDELHALEG
jgi:NADH-quinone oxidoreductase subunit K